MNHNSYKIADLYRDKVLNETWGVGEAISDTRNSYQTTASMSGPGHGPLNASNGQNAEFGDKVMFPQDAELTNADKSILLIKFFKKEIDEGTWEEKTKTIFKELLDHLLDVESSEDDK